MNNLRVILGIIAGISATILWHIFGWRWLAWIMCRIEVLTPLDWAPKTRTWIRGELQ